MQDSIKAETVNVKQNLPAFWLLSVCLFIPSEKLIELEGLAYTTFFINKNSGFIWSNSIEEI